MLDFFVLFTLFILDTPSQHFCSLEPGAKPALKNICMCAFFFISQNKSSSDSAWNYHNILYETLYMLMMIPLCFHLIPHWIERIEIEVNAPAFLWYCSAVSNTLQHFSFHLILLLSWVRLMGLHWWLFRFFFSRYHIIEARFEKKRNITRKNGSKYGLGGK